MAEKNINIIISADVANAQQKIEAFSNTLAKTGKTSNSASIALSNLGRVAQDAPFGFIAIQNNLNPLLESFQRLQKESGSTGSALKSLGGALVGGAGVGLALSLVSSLLIKFPEILSTVSAATLRAKANQEDYNKAMAGSIAPIQTQLTQLSSLIQIARDYSLSLEIRKNAVDEIHRQYPQTLDFINAENINSQEAQNAINGLTDSMIRKAQVQAVTNQLTKANEKLLEDQNGDLSKQVNFFDALGQGILHASNKGKAALGLLTIAQKNQSKAVKEDTALVSNYSKQLDELTRVQAKAGDFAINNPTKGIKPVKIKAKVDPDINKIEEELEKLHFKIQASLNDAKPVEIPVALKLPKISDRTQGSFKLEIPDLDGGEAYDKLQQQAEDMSSIINDTLANSFAGLGEGIGNAIIGKGNLFGSIFQYLADGLKTLGKYLITSSILIAKVKATIAAAFSSNPIVGIALGVGLIALGTILQNAIPKFATGGVVTKPTLALIGEQGPERVTPLGYTGSANNAMEGNVTFTISGNTLRGVLKRADNSAQIFG